MRDGVFIGCIWFCAVLSGCGGSDRTVWDNLEETHRENTELSLQVEALRQENEQLRRQVQTLSGFDEQARLADLATLAEIRIHPRTKLYDTDEDGTCESLVVYLQTIDSQQDTVKAAGHCTIELWNLDLPAAEAKLAGWTLSGRTLQETWGGNIFHQYYRMALPLEGKAVEGENLTVKAVFTDLLTGKVVADQFPFRR